jgi:hypothetical protein
MKRIYSILWISVFTALLFSCKKDDTTSNNTNNNNNTTPKTPKELLVGTWQADSAYAVDPNGGQSNNLPDCSKDNTITFKADGTYTTDEGAVKCSPADDQTLQGTWQMDSYPALKFKLNTSADFSAVTVTVIDNQYFKYSEPSDNGQVTYISVFKRK